MKKFSLLLLVLLVISCKNTDKPNYSVISGTIENNTAETAHIAGFDFKKDIPVTEAGTFSDTLRIDKDGFYQLFVGRERTGVYLEKGKNLTVNLNADEFDESLKYSGDLSGINNFLAAKYLWNEKNVNFKDLFTLNETEFLKKLDENQVKFDSIYSAKKIEDANFKKMLNSEDEYARTSLIESYQDAHKYYSGDENYQVSASFYDELKNVNYTDTLAFRNSEAYQSMLENHFNRLVNDETYASGNNNQTVLYLKKVNADLPDGYAKDKVMSSYLQYGLKPDENLDEVYTIYKNSNPNAENLAKITERYDQLKTITKGNPSPTFDFENHKGGKTSLSELKGKYVYIDVWATWCGPCLREIPSLKDVEKDYEGKNISFVSISIDEQKDHDKWTGMVTENHLGGIQLMADNNWKSKFVTDYSILGIPRFILLDPEGNIVSADAPRPSDQELRNMLDKLI